MLIKKIRNFEAIELPLNTVQLYLYFVKYVFLHNGTQLEGEKCKFQKLQNKDHPRVREIKLGVETEHESSGLYVLMRGDVGELKRGVTLTECGR